MWMKYLRSKRSQLNLSAVAYFHMRFQKVAVATVVLPLVAFTFCVVWSLLFYFESATFTHCQVINYLPSVSATIGSYYPQRYIWQMCVFIHSAPRYLIVGMYYSHLYDILFDSALWQWLASLVFFLQLTEVTSLLGLTFVPSSENFQIHKLCFTAFMVSSICGMVILYLLMRLGTRHTPSSLEETSLHYKLSLMSMNLTSAGLAVYFYYRHNMYCEPMVYTFFAFFEYLVVFTNMGYHMTAYWDFCEHMITVSSCCTVSVHSGKKHHPLSSGSIPPGDFIIKIA